MVLPSAGRLMRRDQSSLSPHRDQRFAGVRRGDGELGGFAVGVGRLVELQRDAVRAHALGFVILADQPA